LLKVAYSKIVQARALAAPRRRARTRASVLCARAPVASASAPARHPSRAPYLGIRAPMRLVFYPVPRVAPCRRAVRARRAPGGLPVRPAPVVHTPTETPPYHGCIFVVTTSSPASVYLKVAPPLARVLCRAARHYRAARHGSRQRRALASRRS
jgi:hypothetical protein